MRNLIQPKADSGGQGEGCLPLLCAKQVADLLGVEVRKVYRLWDSGDIQSCRLGHGKQSPRRCWPVNVGDYLKREFASEQDRLAVADQNIPLATARTSVVGAFLRSSWWTTASKPKTEPHFSQGIWP